MEGDRMLEINHRTPEEKIAYFQGVKAGIRLYAWWKDGSQFVGTCGTTLKVALERIELLQTPHSQTRKDL